MIFTDNVKFIENEECMNLQHIMAEKIAQMLGANDENEEERLWIIFGIEVFLNEFFKILCACVLGIWLKILQEVIFSITFLLLLRKFAGGRHFESNFLCYIVSIATIICPTLIGTCMDFPINVIRAICILEVLFFAFYAPYIENDIMTQKQTYIYKIISLCILVFGVLMGDWIDNMIYSEISIMIGMIEGISLIKFSDY